MLKKHIRNMLKQLIERSLSSNMEILLSVEDNEQNAKSRLHDLHIEFPEYQFRRYECNIYVYKAQ